jgi:hypothetical protein
MGYETIFIFYTQTNAQWGKSGGLHLYIVAWAHIQRVSTVAHPSLLKTYCIQTSMFGLHVVPCTRLQNQFLERQLSTDSRYTS